MKSMEIEIKLLPVPPQTAEAIFADAALAPHLSPRQKGQLSTVYFDAPGGALSRLGCALRLRRQDGAGLCAFKSAPDAQGARLELERPAETLAQGLADLLSDPRLPAAAREILAAGGLAPVAETRFTRAFAHYAQGGLAFDLCFDLGEARKLLPADGGLGVRTGAISEVELELVSGSAEALEAVANDLCRRYGLSVGRLSKLEQALALDSRDAGQPVNPFFVSNELLNHCIRSGWIDLVIDAGKQLHYRLTEAGARELPARFGVDFGKPCAFAHQEAGEED